MVYPSKIWERADCRGAQIHSEESSLGRAASFRCGCFVEFAAEIDDGIKSVTFRTNGCGYMIASAAVLAEMVEGRQLSDLQGLSDASLFASVEAELGALPPGRRQCADVAIEALHAVFYNCRSSRIDEFRGEKALICTCFGVTEETLEEFIAAYSPNSIEEVTAACRAGGGCGSCRMLIQEMLDGSAAYDNSNA